MRWYQELIQASQQATADVMECARLTVLSREELPELSQDDPVLPPSSPAASSSPSLPSSPLPTSSSPVPHLHHPTSPDELPQDGETSPAATLSPTSNLHSDSQPNEPKSPLLRPSEYLRRRCPLCFGSKVSHNPDAMYVFFLSILFRELY